MLDAHVPEVLKRIKPDDVVLDIGGWGRPFNRANHVLDSGPYETRGQWYEQHFGLKGQGGAVEHFTRDTWVVRDICEHTPWPYADKSIDYCTCSHTLEDIRDPLWVCSEMIRVAKAGYIEIPSRLSEHCRGKEPGIVGLSHHRWLIEIQGSHIRFLQKFHAIHGDYRNGLPPSFWKRLTDEQLVTWLFWDGSFTYEEVTIHGVDAINAELAAFVARHYQYPAPRQVWESVKGQTGRAAALPGRALRKIARTMKSKSGA